MALYADFVEDDRFSKPNSDSFQKVIASKDNFVLVAEKDSKLAGFITASKRLVIRYPAPIMQVDELYVDPAFRRHGVGGQLIREVEKLAAENNCRRVYIESDYKHMLGHRFYEKHGYQNRGYHFLKIV